MIKVVIFDLDDTLVMERYFAFSAFDEISKIVEPIFNDTALNISKKMKTFYKKNTANVFDNVFISYNQELKKEYKEHLIEVYRNHLPKINMSTSNISTLKRIKKKGIKLGIITDGFKTSQRNKIIALKLDKYIDFIIITDELGPEFWKPSTLSFELMKEKFGVSFHEMVYVGDNINKDFIAPNSLSMISVMMKSKDGVYKDSTYSLINQKPKYIINEPHEILNFLDDKEYI